MKLILGQPRPNPGRRSLHGMDFLPAPYAWFCDLRRAAKFSEITHQKAREISTGSSTSLTQGVWPKGKGQYFGMPVLAHTF